MDEQTICMCDGNSHASGNSTCYDICRRKLGGYEEGYLEEDSTAENTDANQDPSGEIRRMLYQIR